MVNTVLKTRVLKERCAYVSAYVKRVLGSRGFHTICRVAGCTSTPKTKSPLQMPARFPPLDNGRHIVVRGLLTRLPVL